MLLCHINSAGEKNMSRLRIISMVPSWTEMLLECGFLVVGRTRYCIHPDERVSEIAVVGGTKDLDVEKCRGLDADLIIFDQEENTKQMSELADTHLGAVWYATHIISVQSMPSELLRLVEKLQDMILKKSLNPSDMSEYGMLESDTLKTDLLTKPTSIFDSSQSDFAGSDSASQPHGGPARDPSQDSDALRSLKNIIQRWQQVLECEQYLGVAGAQVSFPASHKTDDAIFSRSANQPTKEGHLSKLFEAAKPVSGVVTFGSDISFAYLIWRGPYLCVSSKTFIGSIFQLFGINLWSGETEGKYPEIDINKIPQNAQVLLSTEPYPFAKKTKEVLADFAARPDCSIALVDGESFSWFGVRSLRFLEQTLLGNRVD
jgi:hypothetical protein